MHRFVLSLAALALLASCDSEPPPPETDAGPPPVDAGPARDPRPALTHPTLLVTPADRDLVLGRVDREPYATILARLRDHAAADLRDPDPVTWDHRAYGHNGCIAQSNAMLAWLYDDGAAAERAKAILLDLRPDVETNDTWDLNIRMPAPLMCHAAAWDLLMALGALSDAEMQQIEDTLTAITSNFYEEFVLTRAIRTITLGFSQNNHPIRTASAIGYVALAFPHHPESDRWLDWAVSELAYLLGENGQYIQSDGGVSEGPFYFGFGSEAAIGFLHALENVGIEDHVYRRDCINRRDVDPWQDHGCVSGEELTFADHLETDFYRSAQDWSIAIRLPSGQRPPFCDARLYTPGHAALLTGYGGPPHFLWDWMTNTEEPMRMDSPLLAQYLVSLDDTAPAEEPPYRNVFLPTAGNAVFRSGWDPEARWLMLVAENGAVRRTLHDHADGTSFSVAAYGDYLLTDTGYYKPDMLNNALTADPVAHNVILIDGVGAPEKGLLNDWGDADAFLENTLDGDALAWAEARQEYEETNIVRGVAFVRRRYFVIADRLGTERGDLREHRFRLHANAGLDLGYTFALGAEGLHVARESGGVHVFTSSTEGAVVWEEPPYTPLMAPHVPRVRGRDGGRPRRRGRGRRRRRAGLPQRDRALPRRRRDGRGRAARRHAARRGERRGGLARRGRGLHRPRLAARPRGGGRPDAAGRRARDERRRGDDRLRRRRPRADRARDRGHDRRDDVLERGRGRRRRGGTVRGVALLTVLALAACDGPAEEDAGPGDAGPIDAGFDAGDPVPDAGTFPDPAVPFPDQCEAGRAPDDACFAMRRDPSSELVSLAGELADRYVDEHPPETLPWDWSEAVLMHALLELSRVNGDAGLRDYVAAWLDHHIAAGYELEWSDHCPPSLSAMALWLERDEPAYRRVVLDVLDYYGRVPRTDVGGVGHLGFLGRTNPAQWLDSLMMVGLPLARWGEMVNDMARGRRCRVPGARVHRDDAGPERLLRARVHVDRRRAGPGRVLGARQRLGRRGAARDVARAPRPRRGEPDPRGGRDLAERRGDRGAGSGDGPLLAGDQPARRDLPRVERDGARRLRSRARRALRVPGPGGDGPRDRRGDRRPPDDDPARRDGPPRADRHLGTDDGRRLRLLRVHPARGGPALRGGRRDPRAHRGLGPRRAPLITALISAGRPRRA